MRKIIFGLGILSLTAFAQDLAIHGQLSAEDANSSRETSRSPWDQFIGCDGIPTYLPNSNVLGFNKITQRELPLRVMLLEKNSQSQAAKFIVTADDFVKSLNAETTINGVSVVKFKKSSVAFGDVPLQADLINIPKLTAKYGHSNFLTVLVVKDLKKNLDSSLGFPSKFRAAWQKGVVVVDKDFF